eukprot:769637-Prymnesium_polylepis.1
MLSSTGRSKIDIVCAHAAGTSLSRLHVGTASPTSLFCRKFGSCLYSACTWTAPPAERTARICRSTHYS